MTRFGVEILPEAEAEIRAAFLWYFERSPIAADAFRSETLEAIDRLDIDALMWPEDEDAIRRHSNRARRRAPAPQARILARALSTQYVTQANQGFDKLSPNGRLSYRF